MRFIRNISKLPVKDMPDEVLLQQMAEDDQRAFAALYDRYWEELFVTAARALQSEKEASDAVQDVFLSIWCRRKELNAKLSLPAYLHASIRYKCIHYIEKNTTRHDYLVQLTDMAACSLPIAQNNLQLRDIQQAISKTVAKMPPKMQAVYKLSRHEHLSFIEISAQLSISVETVKKHIQHALQRIREAIEFYSFVLIFFNLFFIA